MSEPTDAMILAALNAYANAGLELDGYEATEEYPSLEMWGGRFASQMRAALVAAQGAARPINGFDTTAECVKNAGESSHVLDPEKVAEVIDREFDDYRPMYPADGSRCIDSNAARALCEAYTEGKLT